MRYDLKIPSDEPVISLGSEIVYSQRVEWCGATWRPLCLSLMRSRQFFYFDKPEVLPVIVFFCGGGFTNVDRNVWMPELAWFAKRGFAVASVEYSVTPRTRFPMQVEDVKQAIRFLRAHAEEYRIDTDRMVVWGESAGAYLSAFVGLTGNRKEYDVGDYLDQSSKVRGAIMFYPPCRMDIADATSVDSVVPRDVCNFTNLDALIEDDAPPCMILHGTADTQVPVSEGERLYDALQAKNIRSDLYVLEGAEHADAPFVQPVIKEKILAFINEALGAS